MGRVYNWICAIVAGFGSVLYGYDTAVIAGTFAQPGFLAQFNPSSALLGAISTSYFAGVCAGIIAVFAFADRYSRKRLLQFGGVLGLIGAIMQTAAQNIAVFSVGRIVSGVASGIMLTTVQVYQSEIAPPAIRGRMVSLQLLIITLSGTTAAFTGYGTYHSSNADIQWRVPIALQGVPAIGLIVGCFFIPFSPRWLVMHGRHEEARAVLKRLHDDNEDHTFWEKEYIVIASQVEMERQETENVRWWHMFTNKNERHRAMLSVVALTSTQTNGAQTIQVFQSVLYAALGFSTSKSLLMTGVFQLCMNAGGVVNLLAIDYLGRRLLLLFGLVSLSVCLAIFVVCQAQFEKTNELAWGKAGVSMVMIFIFFFGCTYLSTGYAYAAEVLPTKIRAQGMAVGMLSAYVITVVFSQVTPIALDAISYRYPIVFICCNLFFIPIVYVWLKETKGLSLEEINAVFGEVVVRRLVDVTEADTKDWAAHHETKV